MEITGFKHLYTGKVRELYAPLDENFDHLVLIVASDRVSAFDHVLEPEIPGKGANLTEMTNWWFDRLDIQNHRSDELAKRSQSRTDSIDHFSQYPEWCHQNFLDIGFRHGGNGIDAFFDRGINAVQRDFSAFHFDPLGDGARHRQW